MDEEYEEYYDDGAAAEEAAYQEMCDAGADDEARQLAEEGEAAAAQAELDNIVDREKIINEEKCERRCPECSHGKKPKPQTST